ncbi:MAG TPA: ABC transporter ATP-binding protein, partial [Pseudonocardiaceae bacterium]|nr:ABC transporter ATP-binding protein [Pseudonocardiaceae bacterium]
LEKARDRLTALVERSGILVFASHSDEFLVELWTSALWLDHGEIREQGDLRKVLSHYKGKDPYDALSKEALDRIGATR